MGHRVEDSVGTPEKWDWFRTGTRHHYMRLFGDNAFILISNKNV